MNKRLFFAAALTMLVLSACGEPAAAGTAPPVTPTPYTLPQITDDGTENVYLAINPLYPTYTQAVVTTEEIRLVPTSNGESIGYGRDRVVCPVMAACRTVELYETGRTVETTWLLISFETSDASTNMGWVPMEDCIEYNEEAQSIIRGPFTFSEIRVYSEDKKTDMGVLDFDNNCTLYIDDPEPNEHGLVHAYVSGWSGWVMRSDLICPEIGDSYFAHWPLDAE